jgi:AcrR family transcriptional regulator
MARRLDDQGHALLDAASRLLSAEGPGALTVRRIATEAGCSTMGLYSRFGSKDGVVDELYKEGAQQLLDAIEGVRETGDPIEDLRRCCLAYRTNALENATHYLVVFGGAVPGFEPSDEARITCYAAFERLVERVRRCQDAGVFGDEPADVLAELIWGTIHGPVMLELVGMKATPGDPLDRYERVLQLIVDGLTRDRARQSGPE